VAALALLGGWLWYRRRGARDVTALAVGQDGGLLTEFADGRQVASDLMPGTRLLGRTVALRWRAGAEVRHVWLTPWDVPADRLRALAVRLKAARTSAGA
jgi:hypothetical protein